MHYRFQALPLDYLGKELGPFFAQAAEPGLGELQELPPLPLGLAGASVPSRKAEVLNGRPALYPTLGP